ncbi:bifunctional RNase H/acid phosphatase [Nocardioides salsibiostraticola]
MSQPDPARIVIEADGASRGNPGPASYGVVLMDAENGSVLAQEGTVIGRATNNVAEYRGLVAGLKLVERVAPNAAAVEVRMDSKLVVEQMRGVWKIKHPEMQRLAREASEVIAAAGFDMTYTWIPRADNSAADQLANEALDGTRDGVTVTGQGTSEDAESTPRPPVTTTPSIQQQARGWSGPGDVSTTLILVRHGVTHLTAGKRFSGGLGGSNPGLSDEGREQIRATGEWLGPMAERIDAVVASPVRRTHESAEILAERWGKDLHFEPDFAEMEFGAWDEKSFADVARDHGPDLDAWLGSLDAKAGGGESFREVEARVSAGLGRLLETHAGRTLVVVSHVTPIKTLVTRALGVPLESVFQMELTPASVTVMSYFGEQEPKGSLRLFNAMAPGRDGWHSPSVW